MGKFVKTGRMEQKGLEKKKRKKNVDSSSS